MASRAEPVAIGTGVVLRRDGHILLGFRRGAHGAGEWSFPGGKPDGGEEPLQTALRELREETGVIVSPRNAKPLPVWTYDSFPDDDLHYVTLYFLADAPPDQHVMLREPEKCSEWRWFKVHTGVGSPDVLKLPEGHKAFAGVTAALGSLGIRVECPEPWNPDDDYRLEID